MKERGRSAAAILHDIEDRAVRLPHALLRQHTDLGDRVVNIAADDALAVAEFAVVQIHAVPMMPASTAAAILAAQDGFAPSQMVPERMATALTTVCATAS